MKNYLRLPKSRSPRKKQSKSLVLFLIILLMGAALVGYLVVPKIQLNEKPKIIQNCVRKELCPDRIEALERLVKAKKSLKFYNLSSANLSHANLSSANLSHADLRSAHLSHTNLSRANLSRADFSTANLDHANLSHAHLSRADLISAHLDQANLDHANLSHANLSSTDLINAHLSHTNLSHAHLSSTDLSSANLSHADLTNANFSHANFKSANVFSADLSHAQNLTLSQIKTACNWSQAFYKSDWHNQTRKWIVNEEENQQYIKKLKQDRASDPQEPVDCSQWK